MIIYNVYIWLLIVVWFELSFELSFITIDSKIWWPYALSVFQIQQDI